VTNTHLKVATALLSGLSRIDGHIFKTVIWKATSIGQQCES